MAKKDVLANLSDAQKKELLAELQKQESEKKKKIRDDRNAYKALVNETIPSLFTELKEVSKSLSRIKARVYSEVDSLVKMKSDVYGREQDQNSHTFTTDDGISITIGYNLTDGWDDTAEVGVQKVKDFIRKMAVDKNSSDLAETVLHLLSRDNQGNLKASRVLQLRKLAENNGNAEFIDAIDVIQEAYRPKRTKEFIRCRYINQASGESIDLPLTITDAPIEEVTKS